MTKANLETISYKLTNLRCEYLNNPLSVDASKPRLSWEGTSTQRGAKQKAYQILCASSVAKLNIDNGDLWNSGKVESNASLHLKYSGKKLKSRQQVFWKVKIWDDTEKESNWSKPASFSMGLLKKKDWRCRWIQNPLAGTHYSPIFRKHIHTEKEVKRAVIYVACRGLIHLSLNGKDVSDELFATGWSDYRQSQYYRAYDVTKLLNQSQDHCIGAELADGWFKGAMGWERKYNNYGQHLSFKAQLYLEYTDGTSEEIPTDSSWKTTFGPTQSADFYGGEHYDAQLLPRGWNKVGFDDNTWNSVIISKEPPKDLRMQSYPAEPVRRTEEIKAVQMYTIAPGKYIFDFGQNFAGFVRLKLKGKAGAVIKLRHGEMVNKDKSLYIENLRDAQATDYYTMKGNMRETWEPKFTFHGFRYCEISGCPTKPSLDSLTGIVVGSDTRRVGHFSCSNPMINQIYSNAVWTQRANFLEVPTDCPQRDERLGWTGDAQVFIRTAICNMDVAAFFSKWLTDFRESQNSDGAVPNVVPNVLSNSLGNATYGDAAWGDAIAVCPLTLYKCYEDIELLEKMYQPICAYLGHLKKTSQKHLRNPELTHSFGDWLSIDADTPVEVVQTAHFAHVANLTKDIAVILKKKKDAIKFQQLFKNIAKAFNTAFVKNNGKIEGDTQTAYAMALKFNLLDQKKRELAIQHLIKGIKEKKNHLSTGFVGTGLIMSVLRDVGHTELAYKLLENKTFPSWGYSVENGATSIWERWNGWTKEHGPGDVNMNSYSHYAYGAVAEWMFDTIAGIDIGSKGFQSFTIKPQPGGSLISAAAQYHSPYGLIKSRWRKMEKYDEYTLTIPTNTSAEITLPNPSLDDIKVDSLPASEHPNLEINDGNIILHSGTYTLTSIR